MQKISKEDITKKFRQYSFDCDNAIALNKSDIDLLLESEEIYFVEEKLSTTKIMNIHFDKYNISNANTILINFTLHTDYSISIISEIMNILSDLCKEDASIILSTTPTDACDRSYVKLDIFLSF